MVRLQQFNRNIALVNLLSKINLENVHDLPKLDKIVLNIGLKDIHSNKKMLISALFALELISRQKGVVTFSKKAIINWKIRKNMVVGCKVTLRKKNLFIFLDKLLFCVIPSLKEFKGFKVYDFQNYSFINFTIKNILSFYELEQEYDSFKFLRSLDLTLLVKNMKLHDSRVYFNSMFFPLKQLSNFKELEQFAKIT